MVIQELHGAISTSPASVAAIQRMVGVAADGVFGPKTQAAVVAWQRSHGLAADGVVGPLTLAKMGLSGGGTYRAGSTARASVAPSGGSTGTRTAATAGKSAATSANWATSAAGKAAGYGWSIAVINSNPELKGLFAKASQQNWTPDEFVARVRDTTWFKTHSDTARQALILQKADPATYNERTLSNVATARSMAASLGARVTAAQLNTIGSEALLYNWTTDQLKQHMTAFVTAGTGGQYSGSAGTEQNQYNQLAQDYGISLAPAQMAKFIQDSVLGTANQQTVQNWMIAQSASRYPALSQRLQSGETLKQIADPYVQSQAKVFETNPNAINLTDPSIQSALSGKDSSGKPAVMSVWQYEQNLRQDPRFMKTQQAQDNGMQMAHSVLKDMGVQS